jgi:quercetin dioxygenase-like cupin family protein
MTNIFPPTIKRLPEVEFPFKTVKGFLSQGESHQIVFMEFHDDTDIPEHSHKSQWEIVLQGKVDLICDDIKKTYIKGDQFYIRENQKHSAHVYKGYASIAFFNEKSRYKKKDK